MSGQLSQLSMENGYNICVHYDTRNRGIGLKGGVGWPRSKKQLDQYKKITTTRNSEGKPNAMIVGYKTLLSVPAKSIKFGFPDRLTYVVGRDTLPPAGYEVSPTETAPTTGTYYGIKYCDSFESAINAAYDDGCGEVFVNGGTSLYDLVLTQYPQFCKKIFVEEMLFPVEYESDRFFPELTDRFKEVNSEEHVDTITDKKTGVTTNINMRFLTFENNNFADLVHYL